MKKVVLSALLLATVAVSASAEIYRGNDGVNYSGPDRNQRYSCTWTNYSGSAVTPGYSYWTWTAVYLNGADGKPMPRGTEHFLAENRYGQRFEEGYKATWAKPVNRTDQYGLPYTEWEYTFNPYGPQCRKANVYFNAFQLVFSECSDGHSRTCQRVY